ERLRAATEHPAHRFWAADVSLLDTGRVRWSRLVGHRQVTDAYLLALAVKNGGRFVTFDRRVALDAVTDARPEHLVVIGE
ncbi:PIN domain-containing protein, partial [Deferrisoma palaeochoriense]